MAGNFEGGPLTRQPVASEVGKAREREIAKDYASSQERRRAMAIFGGSKQDTRPVDEGLGKLRGSDEATAVAFWKKRLELTAQVGSEVARVGALTPQLRELTRMTDREERKRLTRARIIAFSQLSPEQRQLVGEARRKAFAVDPGVMEDDQAFVDEILPTLDQSVVAVYPRRP